MHNNRQPSLETQKRGIMNFIHFSQFFFMNDIMTTKCKPWLLVLLMAAWRKEFRIKKRFHSLHQLSFASTNIFTNQNRSHNGNLHFPASPPTLRHIVVGKMVGKKFNKMQNGFQFFEKKKFFFGTRILFAASFVCSTCTANGWKNTLKDQIKSIWSALQHDYIFHWISQPKQRVHRAPKM